ncbi:hypothetical protein K501DRAFT_233441 [Backusella circina FSU 941]|nr:hypothetical protein K501DRAFT_233441 [Backusella circina FSU 941]
MFESLKPKLKLLFYGGSEEERQILLQEQRVITEDHDKYKIVYGIYFLYGVAMLLPWNVFITASEFFANRYAGTIYEETFQNYFSTYSTAANLLIFVLILWLQNRSTLKLNATIPIIINTLVFGIMAITVKTDMKGEEYFYLSLFFITLTGGVTSVFQSSVFSEASQLPPIYLQAVLSGQGIAGVIVAVSSILSALSVKTNVIVDGTSVDSSAFSYFLTAFGITLASLLSRSYITTNSFYRSQMLQSSEILVDDVEEESIEEAPVTVMQVVRKSYGLVLSLGYIFVITLMLFPSITALIKSVRRHDPIPSIRDNDDIFSRFFDDDIFVAFHFLLFNVGDWVGRIMPIWKIFVTYKVNYLVFLSAIRTAFIPLFLLCNVVVSNARHIPVLIASDFWYMVIVLVFAVTNGWICSLAMMAAPQLPAIKGNREKAMVGSVMSFSLVFGLAVGGGVSFLVRWMV